VSKLLAILVVRENLSGTRWCWYTERAPNQSANGGHNGCISPYPVSIVGANSASDTAAITLSTSIQHSAISIQSRNRHYWLAKSAGAKARTISCLFHGHKSTPTTATAAVVEDPGKCPCFHRSG